jgi:hypothetical protein
MQPQIKHFQCTNVNPKIQIYLRNHIQTTERKLFPKLPMLMKHNGTLTLLKNPNQTQRCSTHANKVKLTRNAHSKTDIPIDLGTNHHRETETVLFGSETHRIGDERKA